MNLGIFATPALSTTTTTTTMGWIRKTPEVHDEQRVILINQGPNILNYGRSFLCIGLIENNLNNCLGRVEVPKSRIFRGEVIEKILENLFFCQWTDKIILNKARSQRKKTILFGNFS